MNTHRSRLALAGILGILVALAGQADPPAATGTIRGLVRFTGTVPPAEKITTADGAVIMHRDLVIDGKSKGLRDVYALLEDAPAQAKVAKAEPAYLDQRDMVFLPRVLAVRHGQAVRFDNNDLCNHSVQAASTVAANSFNRFVSPTQPFDHHFELQTRPVLIGCSLHGWMRAWVYVAPHPWFALTDAGGKFQIDAVPPGKYTLWLRHQDSGLQERRQVEVAAGKTVEVAVDWDKTPAK